MYLIASAMVILCDNSVILPFNVLSGHAGFCVGTQLGRIKAKCNVRK